MKLVKSLNLRRLFRELTRQKDKQKKGKQKANHCLYCLEAARLVWSSALFTNIERNLVRLFLCANHVDVVCDQHLTSTAHCCTPLKGEREKCKT